MDRNDEALFAALMFSLHAAGMQQLGKVMNPMTGKIEKDLQQAQSTIDMMEMLKTKTEGNLSENESKSLNHFLYELQMNFVEEAETEKKETKSADNSKSNTEEKPEEKEQE